jgi:mersacidin/lichenicidin family type 2 lantibiotic
MIMSNLNTIRAWKDEEYRKSLTDAEKALLPTNPAGLVELAEEEMNQVDGGTYHTYYCSFEYCQPMW